MFNNRSTAWVPREEWRHILGTIFSHEMLLQWSLPF